MQVRDILKFNKDKYFGGAVQANWFYDADKVSAIADSYVFHGPKYHGVKQQEWQNTSYKLNDTATYAMKLVKKTAETESNRFCMTIAGYGTGKSHLSVALASLLSGHDNELRQLVIKNISAADRQLCEEIITNLHKNLVIVLNGMRDFNLTEHQGSTAYSCHKFFHRLSFHQNGRFSSMSVRTGCAFLLPEKCISSTLTSVAVRF